MNRSAIPFAVIAGISIIAAGFLSAITAFSPGYTASWAVAYLILVVGVAQLALGVGQAWITEKAPSKGLIIAQIITFNLANAATIGGTVIASIALVYFGAALFIIALGLFLWGTRIVKSKSTFIVYGFRAIVVFLIVSAGVGLVIASVKK
jgi:hypothetical protein